MSSDSNHEGCSPNVSSAGEKPPDGILANSELRARYPDAASLSEAKRWAALGKPGLPVALGKSKLTPEERRVLVEKPFPRIGSIVVHGRSSGHGGVELPPTVDAEGYYHGDNPWRSRRKPSLNDYEGHE